MISKVLFLKVFKYREVIETVFSGLTTLKPFIYWKTHCLNINTWELGRKGHEGYFTYFPVIKFPLILSFDFSFCLNIKSWNWLDRTNAEECILEHKLSILLLKTKDSLIGLSYTDLYQYANKPEQHTKHNNVVYIHTYTLYNN